MDRNKGRHTTKDVDTGDYPEISPNRDRQRVDTGDTHPDQDRQARRHTRRHTPMCIQPHTHTHTRTQGFASFPIPSD